MTIRTESKIESPCIQHCQLDKNNVCAGCGRTLAEIANWTNMDAVSRQAVLDRLTRTS